MAKSNKSNFTTGVVRAAYVKIGDRAEDAVDFNGKPIKKHSMCLIVSKDDTRTIQILEDAIAEVKNTNPTFWGGTAAPRNLKSPLKDGDAEISKEGKEEFENSVYFNVKSNYEPKAYNTSKQQISLDDVYSGAYIRITGSVYPYNAQGSKGIAFGLNNIQFIRDGEKLGGDGAFGADNGASAFDDFEV